MTRGNVRGGDRVVQVSRLRTSVVYRIEPDRTHLWGDFIALALSNTLLCRAIRFHAGGRTSIHRHPVSETLLAQYGTLEVRIGFDQGQVTNIRLRPGEMVVIPKNVFHCVRCVKPMSRSHRFALALESVSGQLTRGKYSIERIEPAIAGTARRAPRSRKR